MSQNSDNHKIHYDISHLDQQKINKKRILLNQDSRFLGDSVSNGISGQKTCLHLLNSQLQIDSIDADKSSTLQIEDNGSYKSTSPNKISVSGTLMRLEGPSHARSRRGSLAMPDIPAVS